MVKRPKVAEKRSTGLCDLQNPSTPWFLLWLWYLRLFKSLNPASAPEVVSISASIDKYKFPYFHITHLTIFHLGLLHFPKCSFWLHFGVEKFELFCPKKGIINLIWIVGIHFQFRIQNTRNIKLKLWRKRCCSKSWWCTFVKCNEYQIQDLSLKLFWYVLTK